MYVPENKDLIVSLVCNKFRARLSEELVVSESARLLCNSKSVAVLNIVCCRKLAIKSMWLMMMKESHLC